MAKRRSRPARRIHIQAWEIDEANTEELTAHGITLEILEQVLDNQPRFKRNKKNRSATHLMIGPDDGGRMWVACIVERGAGVWRPITGWDAENHDVEWWSRSQ